MLIKNDDTSETDEQLSSDEDAVERRSLQFFVDSNGMDFLSDRSQEVENPCSTLTFTGSGCEHCPTEMMPIADQEYTLFDEPLIFVVDGVQPPRCGYSYTFSATGGLASDGTILFKSIGREFDIYSENVDMLQGAD